MKKYLTGMRKNTIIEPKGAQLGRRDHPIILRFVTLELDLLPKAACQGAWQNPPFSSAIPKCPHESPPSLPHRSLPSTPASIASILGWWSSTYPSNAFPDSSFLASPRQWEQMMSSSSSWAGHVSRGGSGSYAQ